MAPGGGENPWKDLDGQIEQLMRCQPLPEAEVSLPEPCSDSCKLRAERRQGGGVSSLSFSSSACGAS